MNKNLISLSLATNSEHSHNITNFPSLCPICQHHVNPDIIHSCYVYKNKKCHCICVCKCPQCESLYSISFFIINNNKSDNSLADNISFLPHIMPTQDFDERIRNISPKFIKTYNQALQAESLALDEICGVGYRKALEFLIKDYLIYTQSDKPENIVDKLLGQCINMIDFPRLKNAAKMATWLGNDQTHYVQKFTSKDINDLKKLIDISVHWILMSLDTEEYEASMLLENS